MSVEELYVEKSRLEELYWALKESIIEVERQYKAVVNQLTIGINQKDAL